MGLWACYGMPATGIALRYGTPATDIEPRHGMLATDAAHGVSSRTHTTYYPTPMSGTDLSRMPSLRRVRY
eukprot:3211564-Rhodomonas_salina.4